MKVSVVGLSLACLLGLASSSPIADNSENIATTTRDWNMPLTTEPLVDFGKSGFLFRKRGTNNYPNSGKGTFFSPNRGSCGWKNTKHDLIVAVSGKSNKNNSNCGRMIEIVNASGAKVRAKVADTCPGCGKNDLDLSPAAFIKLASYSQGVVKIQWKYVD